MLPWAVEPAAGNAVLVDIEILADQIALGEHEELMIAARQALDDPETAKHLRHTRPRIERLLGMMAVRYGARKSRYIGTNKARLQASWAAALVNLNPIGRQLAVRTG